MDGQKRKTILVIDDSPENIDVLWGALNGDYRVRAAVSGEKALAIATTEPYPDLILLDIMMPGMDGYEVCRRLKADVRVRHVPVIFVTALGEVEDEAKGFAVGAVDYITKPISPMILKARVRIHLELEEARHRLAELVDARTEQLRQANVRLARQVKELHGRDRLIHLQMEGPSMKEACGAIGCVVAEVLEVARVVIFRVEKGGGLAAAVAVSGGDPEHVERPPASSSVAVPESALALAEQALAERQLVRGDGGAVAVPIVFKEEAVGAIWVENFGSQIGIEGEGGAVMTRLSGEAALVLRAAQVADDLINDKIDFDQLLRLGQ